MARDPELQELYRQARQTGLTKRDPELAGLLAQAVKTGLLDDLSQPKPKRGRVEEEPARGVPGFMRARVPGITDREANAVNETLKFYTSIGKAKTPPLPPDKSRGQKERTAARIYQTQTSKNQARIYPTRPKQPIIGEGMAATIVRNTIPAIVSTATAAGTGALGGSIAGPVGTVGGAILGGAAGFIGTRAAQDTLHKRLSPEMEKKLARLEAEYRLDQPVASLIAENAPQGLLSLPTGGSIASRALGGTIGLSAEAAGQVQEGRLNIPRLVTSPVVGALMSGRNTRFGEGVEQAVPRAIRSVPQTAQAIRRNIENVRQQREIEARIPDPNRLPEGPERWLQALATREAQIRGEGLPEQAPPTPARRRVPTRKKPPLRVPIIDEEPRTIPPELDARLAELEAEINTGRPVQDAIQESDINRFLRPQEVPSPQETVESPSVPETPVETPKTTVEALKQRYENEPIRDEASPVWILPEGKPISAGRDHTESALQAIRDTGSDPGMNFNGSLQSVMDNGAIRVNRSNNRFTVDISKNYIPTTDQVLAISRMAADAKKSGIPFDYSFSDYSTGRIADKSNITQNATVERFNNDVFQRSQALATEEGTRSEPGDEVDTQTSEQLFDAVTDGDILTEPGSSVRRTVVKKNSRSIETVNENGVREKITRKDFVNDFDFNRERTQADAIQEGVRQGDDQREHPRGDVELQGDREVRQQPTGEREAGTEADRGGSVQQVQRQVQGGRQEEVGAVESPRGRAEQLQSRPAPAGGEAAAGDVGTPSIPEEAPKVKSKLEEAADRLEADGRRRLEEALKEAGGSLFVNPAGPTAKFITALAEITASRIMKGGLRLAAWSKEMVDQYGEKIRPHLQRIWAEANVLADAETARTNPRKETDPILEGIKMADVERFAEDMGVTLPDKGEWRETFRTTLDRAEREYESILASLDNLDIERNPHISREEYAVINYRMHQIADHDFPQALRALEADPENAELSKRIDDLMEEAAKLSGDAYRASSEAGRRLVFQKALLSGPFDHATLLRRSQALAKGKLDKDVIRTISAIIDLGKETEKRIKARVDERAGEADKRIRGTKPQQTQEQRIAARVRSTGFGENNKTFTREKFDESLRRLGKIASGRLSAGIDPTLLPDLINVGGYYFEGGLRKFSDWASQMRSDVPALEEDNLQHIWINVKADARENQSPKGVPTSQNFADEMARQMGTKNARDFINKLNDTDPTILKQLLASGNLTKIQKDTLESAYRTSQPTRGKGSPSPATAGLRSILKDARKAVRDTEAARKGAEARLSDIEAGAQVKAKAQHQDLVDVATREYADGAIELQALARRMRAMYGNRIDDAAMRTIFQDAARQYRQDYRALEDIKSQLAAKITEEAFNARGLYEKIGITASRILGATRSPVTAFDLSAPGRQGAFLLYANPRMGSKSFIPQLESAFGATGKLGKLGGQKTRMSSEDVAVALEADVKSRVNYPLYKKTGNRKVELFIASSDKKGDLSLREEVFRSDFFEKIRFYGGGIKRSERAYVGFLNKLRADNFDFFVSQIEKGGRKATEAELDMLANFVNAATGRGTLGFLEKHANLLAGFFFSPRFVSSRFQMLTSVPAMAAYGMLNKNRAGLIIARTYAQYLIGIASIFGLTAIGATFFNDKREVETSPLSSDFMKIRTRGLQIDMLHGLSQAITLASRLLTQKTKRRSGLIENLDPDVYPNETPIDVLIQFARLKAAPLTGSVWTILSGMRDFKGDEVTPLMLVGDNTIPMSVPDVIEAAKDIGGGTAAELFLMSTFGLSVNVDERQKPIDKMDEKTLKFMVIEASTDVAQAKAKKEGKPFDRAMHRKSEIASWKGATVEGMRAYLKNPSSKGGVDKPIREKPTRESIPRQAVPSMAR